MSIKLEQQQSSVSQENNLPPTKKKTKALKSSDGTVNTRTIKVPGSKVERVAQARDRCRAKKTKCDGQNPCSTCQSVGLECIVSDRLTRKSYPKAYTETLEERVRQLEAENKKLAGLLDMRDEQLELLNGSGLTEDTSEMSENKEDDFKKVTASNLSLWISKIVCTCICQTRTAKTAHVGAPIHMPSTNDQFR